MKGWKYKPEECAICGRPSILNVHDSCGPSRWAIAQALWLLWRIAFWSSPKGRRAMSVGLAKAVQDGHEQYKQEHKDWKDRE